MLSDITIDANLVRDEIIRVTTDTRDKTLSLTKNHLEMLEEKFGNNCDKVVEQIVRAVAGAR